MGFKRSVEEKDLTLTIEKLAGLGDGLGVSNGRRVFVPYTSPGDIVRARLVRTTTDADYAELLEVLTPAPGRQAPFCRHYSRCGGCQLQHLADADYGEFKQHMAREAVRKAGFDPSLVETVARMPVASRRRAELKIAQGRIGYYAERSHTLIDIEECKVLAPALEALLLRLKPDLIQARALTGLKINTMDGGYDLLLQGEGPVPDLREECLLRVSLAGKEGTRILKQSAPVTVTFGAVKVEAPPGAFLQASSEAQARMTRFVTEAVKGAGRMFDLFAGLGTFSFPLAGQAEITAVESDAPMAAAMRRAALEQGLHRFHAQARDLFRRPVAQDELAGCEAIIINPPRAGAKEQCRALAGAKVKKLVMISCNPATFVRDAQLLKEGGAKLVRALPIDQFLYSSHLEILAEFAL